ncbi:MAG: hypothetical protein SFV81_21420 [Pirellulaceae bacterium]|nr:hypothetical protein [Pirellulaceae bacterium]
MSTTAFTWFNAMATKVAELDTDVVRSNDWEQALQAMHIRVVCFAHHRAEYLRYVQEGICDRSLGESDTAFIVAPIGQPVGEKLSMNAALAVAQLIAAAQSLRAICDCLFRIAYWAHNERENYHSLGTSASILSDLSKSIYGKSKQEHERLTSSFEFRFLDSFVQVAARQNLVTVRRRKIGQPNLRQLELLIREFDAGDCKQELFQAKWASDFLMIDCESIIERCSALGAAIASEMV